jgi:hypothetical protein
MVEPYCNPSTRGIHEHDLNRYCILHSTHNLIQVALLIRCRKTNTGCRQSHVYHKDVIVGCFGLSLDQKACVLSEKEEAHVSFILRI